MSRVLTIVAVAMAVVMVSVSCIEGGVIECFNSCTADYKARLKECSQFDWCSELTNDLLTSCMDICITVYGESVKPGNAFDQRKTITGFNIVAAIHHPKHGFVTYARSDVPIESSQLGSAAIRYNELLRLSTEQRQ
ncbi:hypothetical protein LSAT2_024820 [Lamellibrachia satsuma]|nr:hypothetical protein LSAT2_024820 [Lamellibrachia satsuma]